eukprot:Pgem_evm1s16864
MSRKWGIWKSTQKNSKIVGRSVGEKKLNGPVGSGRKISRSVRSVGKFLEKTSDLTSLLQMSFQM